MADIRKFLDQGGVSTLWSAIAEEVAKVDTKATKNAEDIVELKGKVDALEKGTYDDSAVKELIAGNAAEIAKNKAAHEANASAIAVLNGGAEDAGSVVNTANAAAAAKVAEIVAGADANFDTLKEIADWILNDTTGAADMANDIATLQGLVGDKAVATQIAEAIAAEGLNKYALAADLNALADRVKAIEDAGYQNAAQVSAAITAAIEALKLGDSFDAKGAAATAEVNAKAYADSLAGNYDAAGTGAAAAAQAEANAKAYTDTEVAKIQALTEAEIKAAIEAAKAQA